MHKLFYQTNLNNLTFQCEINYQRKDGSKFVRVISKNLKVSDDFEEISKKANYDIISTNEVQKTAKLANEGHYREAQAQAHVAKKFFKKNRNISNKSEENYHVFSSNLNDLNKDLGELHRASKKSYEESEKLKSKDKFQGKIYSLSKTSKEEEKTSYKRSKKK